MANFINPYNFIPLMEKKSKWEGKKEDVLYTGIIDYSVYTKTPLFIPNSSNDNRYSLMGESEKEKHKSYDFFSYHNLEEESISAEEVKKYCYSPVIPGSEIRGMFRSIYEMLTDSCMSAIQKYDLVSKRTMLTYSPGLLAHGDHGTYRLLKAKSYSIRVRNKEKGEWVSCQNWNGNYSMEECIEGAQVKIKCVPSDKKTRYCLSKDGNIEGYLLKGILDEEGTKKNYHVFTKALDEKGQERVICKAVSIQELEAVLSSYQKNSEKGQSPYEEYEKQLKEFTQNTEKKQTYFPVYYSELRAGNGTRLLLSPACITREVYKNGPQQGMKTYTPCTLSGNPCPACRLFGMLGDKGEAIASHIRFTDLTTKEKVSDCYLSDPALVTLPPLLSPKIASTEFYLKRPEGARFWTYDYYIDQSNHIREYDSGTVMEIAGRKFYWHNLNMKLPDESEKTNLNVTIHPVRSQVKFQGKLYFDGITELELNRIIWMLNAGEKGSVEGKHFGYKLGAAKPLGFGSIAVQVDTVVLREIEKNDEKYMIKNHPYSGEEQVKEILHGCTGEGQNAENPDNECAKNLLMVSEKALKNFYIMTDFWPIGKDENKEFHYPFVENESEEGYQWFMDNHNGIVRERNKFKLKEYMMPLCPELAQTGKQDVAAISAQGTAEYGIVQEVCKSGKIPYAKIKLKKPVEVEEKMCTFGKVEEGIESLKKDQRVQYRVISKDKNGVKLVIVSSDTSSK